KYFLIAAAPGERYAVHPPFILPPSSDTGPSLPQSDRIAYVHISLDVRLVMMVVTSWLLVLLRLGAVLLRCVLLSLRDADLVLLLVFCGLQWGSGDHW